jgi:hypothetical protein
MAEGTGNSNGGLYFIVGALVVAVLVIGFFAFGGSFGGSHKLDVTIEAPKK